MVKYYPFISQYIHIYICVCIPLQIYIYIYIPLYPIHIPKATSAQPHAGTTGIPIIIHYIV